MYLKHFETMQIIQKKRKEQMQLMNPIANGTIGQC